MQLEPTPELRYRRAQADEVGPLLILEQLWRGHHMGRPVEEWREIPIVDAKP